jgi:DNA-binding NarL/FixJ family response regulator
MAPTDTQQNTKDSDDLKLAIQVKKAELEAQLKALDVPNVDKLLQERAQLAAKLAEVDDRIAEIRTHLGLAPKGRKRASRESGQAPRTRMNSQEIRSRILKALSQEKHGLSQKEIADTTAISYGTVAAYLKGNAENFKTTGQLKAKKYFLK